MAEGGDADDFQRRLLEEPIDHEINVGDPFGGTPKPKRGRGGSRTPRTPKDVEIDPKWHEPFQYGWRREIVQRGGDGAGKTCDTYYFPPQGKKLRSMVEIKAYLERTSDIHLTAENFTFVRKAIYKEPEEVFRGAAATRGRATGRPAATSLGGSPASPMSSPRGRGRGSGRGRGRGGMSTPTSTDDDSTSKPPSSRGRGRGRPRGSSSSGMGRGMGSGFKRERDSDSDTSSHTSESTAFPHILSTEADFKPKVKKIKKLSTGFGGGGIVDLTDSGPSINKPKVITISPKPQSPPKPSTPSAITVPKKAVAKKRITARPPSQVYGSGAMPPEKRQKVDSGSVADQSLCSLNCPGRDGVPPQLSCKTCMMLYHPECVNVSETLTAKGFICKNCQSRSPVKSPAATADSAKPKGDDVATIDLSKIINQNQVSGQLLTLPPGVLNHLDLQQPLALKVNNKVLMIPPNCFISSAAAVKVFLPPGTLPNTLFKEKNLPINFNFYAKNNEQILNFTDPSEALPKDPVGDNDKENVSENSTGRLSRRQVKVVNPNECHFTKLHSASDCMLQIFKYLSIAELLRASRVCKTWSKVAQQDILWKVVRLKASCVTDWEQAAKHFKNHNTWYLDLRGMLLQEDRNRTWHQFIAVLENFNQLRQISFSQSPAAILHEVVVKLDKLEVLTADTITDMLPESAMMTTNTKLDIGKFGNMKSLERLTLRGLCGLTLPAFSFNGGLTELKALTNLKTLSLTTLRNVQDSEYLFLGSLTNLEVLEIGDCLTWNEEVYKQLAELKKLTRLRLEYGGAKAEPALTESLKSLKELRTLELFKFPIDAVMGDALKELPKLESVSIWPEDKAEAAQNNTNTMKIFKSLTSLKQIVWGLIENSEAIRLQDDADSGLGVESVAFVDEEAEVPEGGERPEKYIAVSKLRDQLAGAVPSAKVDVQKAPATPVAAASSSS